MRSAHLIVTTICTALVAPAAFAEDLQPLDKYWLGAGMYQSENGLDIRVDGQDQVMGANVSFQDDLGFADHEISFVYDLGITLAEKHQISVTGHRYDSSSGTTLSRELDINDQIYALGAEFDGTMDIDIVSVAYTWFFHRNERSAFGMGLGGVHYSIDLGLSAVAAIDDGEAGQETATVYDDWSESAWLPMVRMQYSQVINDQWRFNVELAGVWRSEGSHSISGNAKDASVSVDYFPWQHFGFSLKYNYDDIDLRYDQPRYRGKMRLINQGPQLLAMVRF